MCNTKVTKRWQSVHAHNPQVPTENTFFDQAFCTAGTCTTTRRSGNHSARLNSPTAEIQRHPHHYAHATTRPMHASAPRPKRSREPSRAQSHRPRHRPHTLPTRTPPKTYARHTHACAIRKHRTSCLSPFSHAFSLCHSPDLTEPPHAL